MDTPQMICEFLIETWKKKKKGLIPRWWRAPAMAVGWAVKVMVCMRKAE
jgi:hypothetical protein